MKNLLIQLLTVGMVLHPLQLFAKNEKWQHESQASVALTDGNAITDSYSVKQSTTYKQDISAVKTNASYLRTAGTDPKTRVRNETALMWDAGLRLEHILSEYWELFEGYKVESNKYAGFLQRHSSDFGAKYYFFKREKSNLFGEAGYRYTHENRTDGTRYYFDGSRLYLESNYAFNAGNSLRLWVEYLSNFDDSNDWLLNYEASVASAFTEHFSLKVAFLSRTDNVPVGTAVKTDTFLTTSLVARY